MVILIVKGEKMATPHIKSQIIKDLLKEYMLNSAGEKIEEEKIQCMDAVGFEECHIYFEEKKAESEFDVNRDSISNGVELPSYLEDFPVYMIWEKQNDRIIWRVFAFWGDIVFK